VLLVKLVAAVRVAAPGNAAGVDTVRQWAPMRLSSKVSFNREDLAEVDLAAVPQVSMLVCCATFGSVRL